MSSYDEESYAAGQHAVWQRLHSMAVSRLSLSDAEQATVELADARAGLRSLCVALDIPIDWDDDLPLADVIENHIRPWLVSRHQQETP